MYISVLGCGQHSWKDVGKVQNMFSFFYHGINQTGLHSAGTVSCLLEESIKCGDLHLKSGSRFKLK